MSKPYPGTATLQTGSAEVARFRSKFFPEIDDISWNSWKWQLQHRITTLADLERFLEPTAAEREAFALGNRRIPFSITPYFMGVLTAHPGSPLRHTGIPVSDEFTTRPAESTDPLAEELHSPVPAIIHRYPNRVLFLATRQCAVHCRYCTRARIFSQPPPAISRTLHWQEGLDYIGKNREIREVIVSGGDPLILEDATIRELLGNLRRIPHVQVIRLGTKLPIVLPQRITPALAEMLRSFHPLILSLHAIHPDELTPEAAGAIGLLADAGLVIGSQTVLLKNVNDNPLVMQRLMEELLRHRVRPYSLFHCDPMLGTGHFRTGIETGLEILEHLRRCSSGYAIPQYVIDPPGGKVSLAPATIISREGLRYRLRNWQGTEIDYTDLPA